MLTARTMNGFLPLATLLVILMTSGSVTAAEPVFPKKQRINGQLIESVTIERGHDVAFFQFENEEIGINETLDLDSQQVPLLFERFSPASAAEVYRLVKPNEPIHPRIIESDLRARLSREREKDDEVANRLSTDGGMTSNQSSTDVEFLLQNLTECPNDGPWVSWECDAEWFLAHFCAAPNDNKYCVTNYPSLFWQRRTGEQMHITGMAAGFDTEARFVIRWRSCGLFDCSWRTHINDILQPREYSSWYFPQRRQRYASIQTVDGEQRTHFAMTYYSEPPPPAPALSAVTLDLVGQPCGRAGCVWRPWIARFPFIRPQSIVYLKNIYSAIVSQTTILLVKAGYSTDDCGRSEAVIPLRPQEMIDRSVIQNLLGVPQQAIVACVVAPPAPNNAYIEMGYMGPGV